MCGKFTAKASWSEIVDLIHATPPAEMDGGDQSLTYRVMGAVPVIVWDRVAGKRRAVPMRWGFPHPSDWRRPQPIHARAETIDTTVSFAGAFRDGQRGIVLVQTFNEAPDSGAQHVVTPAGALGIAFVWRRFHVADAPFFACVMVTVAANNLLSGLPTDRMPACLAPQDWAVWLGEEGASLERVKACLKVADGAGWTMRPEPRAKTTPRGKPVVSDPAGLF